MKILLFKLLFLKKRKKEKEKKKRCLPLPQRFQKTFAHKSMNIKKFIWLHM